MPLPLRQGRRGARDGMLARIHEHPPGHDIGFSPSVEYKRSRQGQHDKIPAPKAAV
jgi:hypothetical protein